MRSFGRRGDVGTPVAPAPPPSRLRAPGRSRCRPARKTAARSAASAKAASRKAKCQLRPDLQERAAEPPRDRRAPRRTGSRSNAPRERRLDARLSACAQRRRPALSNAEHRRRCRNRRRAARRAPPRGRIASATPRSGEGGAMKLERPLAVRGRRQRERVERRNLAAGNRDLGADDIDE